MLAACGLAVLAATGGVYWYYGYAAGNARLAHLKRRHEALEKRFEAGLASQALIRDAEAVTGDVVVAFRTEYLGALIREVTHAYLDRVVLDLRPNIQVHQTGEVRPKTFLGRIHAGQWTLDLTIRELKAVLHAGVPTLSVAGSDRVAVTMPVTLESARGAGQLDFDWDAGALASVVCRDFAIRERLTALAVSTTVAVQGAFVITTGPGGLEARPDFPVQPFKLRLDLTPDSWSKVEAAVEAQDRFLRCGIALDKETLIPRLREITQKGFDVKLPRSLFRTVELPGRVQSEVTVQGVKIDLDVALSGLLLTPDVCWYGSTIRARLDTKTRR